MKVRPRFGAFAVAAALAVTPLGLAATTPAHADRCEPEELVLGPNTSPIDERDHPLCAVLFNYVYPFICTGPNGEQPPPTLLQCVQNLRINPGYRPPVIPPYSPNVGRAFCNLYYVVLPSGACTFIADPVTGDITATTDSAVFTIPTEVTR
jgi:hypothetical protein